jgi:LysR family nitrogen assimilation transcriptional regulator
MDFKALRYFLNVAQLRSLSRAAVHLHVAQPALTRHIQKLEREIGVPLFIRHSRGVSLTEVGIQLVERADALVAHFDRTSAEVIASAGRGRHRIRIAAPPSAGQLLLPPVIENFARVHPNLQFEVAAGQSNFSDEWLLEGRIDLAVVYNAVENNSLNIKPVLRDWLHLVAAPTVPSKRDYRLSDLGDLNLILPSRAHMRRLVIDEAAARSKLKLNVGLEVDEFHLLKAFVEQGLGFTLLTKSSVAREVANGRLRVYPLLRPGIHWKLMIVTRKAHMNPPFLQEVVEAIRIQAQTMIKNGFWAGAKVEND